MFTGLITAVGHITEATDLGTSGSHGKRLSVAASPEWLADVAIGDSIAINGACMTVTGLNAASGVFSVDVSAESLARTVGLDRPGPANLEKALRAGDRFGGHWVSGHVDGTGRLLALSPVGESHRLQLRVPAALAPFMAVKGSVTVHGVSLTINTVSDTPDGCEIGINLIPHTLAQTALGRLAPGDGVNLEIDLLARYVARLLAHREGVVHV